MLIIAAEVGITVRADSYIVKRIHPDYNNRQYRYLP